MLPLKDTVQSRSFPIVNWSLIALNVFIFFIILSLGDRAEVLVAVLGVVPARLLHHPGLFEFATLFTAMFLHGGWAHLPGHMLALDVFGDNGDDRMGSGPYLPFSLLCGLGTSFAQIAPNPPPA